MTVDDEHTELLLIGSGPNRLQVILVVRELTGLGLPAARELVDAAPAVILRGMSTEDARKARRKLEREGAEAETYSTI